MEQEMTLIDRLRNPQYVTNPSGGEALLDTERTTADMREAANLMENMQRALQGYDQEVKVAGELF